MWSVVCLFGVCTVALSQHFGVQTIPWLPVLCRVVAMIVVGANHQDAENCLDVAQNVAGASRCGLGPEESEILKTMLRRR